ncbi:fungal pheromone mating factor STE2 GPCR-domain-containing protein [Trichoderma sp. SZMC 28011]
MAFNPYTQNITIIGPPDFPPILIPITQIDAFNDETASILINYGAQLGASLTMVLVILLTTPSAKFLRASCLLHVLALIVCAVRTVFLAFYFLSPFSHFYQVWSGDYSQIPAWNYRTSIAGTVLSMFLAVIAEGALMYQAWTMVSLFANKAKYAICFLSLLIILITTAFRVAFTVVQCESILSLESSQQYAWLFKTALIFNTCSMAWFCALFNSKIVHHLITNRGVLPSRRAMTPMEVLIMANGILMFIPFIFAILEWCHFINFEAGSLTPTSIAIVLPLASIAAQRISQAPSAPSSEPSYPSSSYQAQYKSTRDSSRTPLKSGSLFSAISKTSSATRSQVADTTVLAPVRDVIDPIDLELRQIDGYAQPKEIHSRAEAGESQLHK